MCGTGNSATEEEDTVDTEDIGKEDDTKEEKDTGESLQEGDRGCVHVHAIIPSSALLRHSRGSNSIVQQCQEEEEEEH